MRMMNYFLLKGLTVILLHILAPLKAQRQAELFYLPQLMKQNHCSQIQQEKVALVPCQIEHFGMSENTISLGTLVPNSRD